MFIAVLFTVAKKFKQSKFPLTGEWINKYGIYIQWKLYGHKKGMKFYATVWMKLEN